MSICGRVSIQGRELASMSSPPFLFLGLLSLFGLDCTPLYLRYVMLRLLSDHGFTNRMVG